MDDLGKTLVDGGAVREAGRASVLVATGPLKGTTYDLASEVVTVGRQAENSICIPSERVTRRHCTLRLQPNGRWALKDEGSLNGTFVNERRLPPDTWRELVHGDTIKVAETVLFFSDPRKGDGTASGDAIRIDRQAAHLEAQRLLAGFTDLRSISRSSRSS
ncbi:MAG: FHA domain-containing protein [Planctomycetes bacterium]|nr:FHA domain-containing protein [Planctomycetota bacterium]